MTRIMVRILKDDLHYREETHCSNYIEGLKLGDVKSVPEHVARMWISAGGAEKFQLRAI